MKFILIYFSIFISIIIGFHSCYYTKKIQKENTKAYNELCATLDINWYYLDIPKSSKGDIFGLVYQNNLDAYELENWGPVPEPGQYKVFIQKNKNNIISYTLLKNGKIESKGGCRDITQQESIKSCFNIKNGETLSLEQPFYIIKNENIKFFFVMKGSRYVNGNSCVD